MERHEPAEEVTRAVSRGPRAGNSVVSAVQKRRASSAASRAPPKASLHRHVGLDRHAPGLVGRSTSVRRDRGPLRRPRLPSPQDRPPTPPDGDSSTPGFTAVVRARGTHGEGRRQRRLDRLPPNRLAATPPSRDTREPTRRRDRGPSSSVRAPDARDGPEQHRQLAVASPCAASASRPSRLIVSVAEDPDGGSSGKGRPTNDGVERRPQHPPPPPRSTLGINFTRCASSSRRSRRWSGGVHRRRFATRTERGHRGAHRVVDHRRRRVAGVPGRGRRVREVRLGARRGGRLRPGAPGEGRPTAAAQRRRLTLALRRLIVRAPSPPPAGARRRSVRRCTRFRPDVRVVRARWRNQPNLGAVVHPLVREARASSQSAPRRPAVAGCRDDPIRADRARGNASSEQREHRRALRGRSAVTGGCGTSTADAGRHAVPRRLTAEPTALDRWPVPASLQPARWASSVEGQWRSALEAFPRSAGGTPPVLAAGRRRRDRQDQMRSSPGR